MIRKTYNQRIQEALVHILKENPHSMLFGLGVSDPKRFFGTTENLLEQFGADRIVECPTAENLYLGHALGLSLCGMTPVVHFQRVDFMLYAFDQLINNVAKWNDMFGRDKNLNLVIRALVGMGWGQGAQHSQNFSSWFSSVPGLVVIAPSCGESAKQLLIQASQLGSPVIQIEHRWLQFLESADQGEKFRIGKAKVRKTGKQGTILTWSYGVVEALRFLELFPLDVEVVDLLSLSPIDMETILASASKTKKVLIWEPGIKEFGIGAELKCRILESHPDIAVERLGYRKTNVPSSHLQISSVYPGLTELAATVSAWLSEVIVPSAEHLKKWPHDQDKSHWSVWT